MYNEYNESKSHQTPEIDISKTFQIDCPIPLDEQKRYFRLSQEKRRNKPHLTEKELDNIEALLYNKQMGDNWHKNTLALLASTGQIRAYRILEDFLMIAPERLRNWAMIAEFDCRIYIKAQLSEQEDITIISSGLGGHNGLMRFMIIVATEGWQKLHDYQISLMQKEFSYSIKHNQGEIENIEFHDTYMSITCLLPIGLAPNPIIQETVDLCNQFGDFLHTDHILITNVSHIEEKDIERLRQTIQSTEITRENIH